MTPIAWYGVWLLAGSAALIVVELALVGIWGFRLSRRARALIRVVEGERTLIEADVAKLRAAIEETRLLWRPYARILRWLRHPLVIALIGVVPPPMGGEVTEVPGSTPTAVQQATEDAVARERSRISRELHDGLATELAGAISLFKVYLESHRGQHDKMLGDVFEILERMLKQVRETLAELRPRPLGADGLTGELRTQADEFARLYSIRVEIAAVGTEDMLPSQQREVVYQVVREALTNVRKHSGSAICRVRLHYAAHPFLIEISDEGRGFAHAQDGGYGLVGMRERAAGIGGRLEVVSTQGKGTTVFLFGPN